MGHCEGCFNYRFRISVSELPYGNRVTHDVLFPFRTCVWCVGVLALVLRAVFWPVLSVASATIHFVSA